MLIGDQLANHQLVSPFYELRPPREGYQRIEETGQPVGIIDVSPRYQSIRIYPVCNDVLYLRFMLDATHDPVFQNQCGNDQANNEWCPVPQDIKCGDQLDEFHVLFRSVPFFTNRRDDDGRRKVRSL